MRSQTGSRNLNDWDYDRLCSLLKGQGAINNIGEPLASKVGIPQDIFLEFVLGVPPGSISAGLQSWRGPLADW